jgi:hypothetical protein
MIRFQHAALTFGFVLATLGLTAPAIAQEDGAYGRLDGDVALALGAGAAIGRGGPALAAQASALYLGTAGAYVRYVDALGSSGPVASRSIACGVALRPFFLARYASNLERGPAWLDLVIDSIGLELGAFWHEPQGARFERSPGLEFGLGVDIPLRSRAIGPYIEARAVFRARDEDLAGSGASLFSAGSLFTLGIAWHHVVGAHVVDAGDGRVR